MMDLYLVIGVIKTGCVDDHYYSFSTVYLCTTATETIITASRSARARSPTTIIAVPTATTALPRLVAKTGLATTLYLLAGLQVIATTLVE